MQEWKEKVRLNNDIDVWTDYSEWVLKRQNRREVAEVAYDCTVALRDDVSVHQDARYVRQWIIRAEMCLDRASSNVQVYEEVLSLGIGTRLPLFYDAYGSAMEKRKRWIDAKRIYELGLTRCEQGASSVLKRRLKALQNRSSEVPGYDRSLVCGRGADERQFEEWRAELLGDAASSMELTLAAGTFALRQLDLLSSDDDDDDDDDDEQLGGGRVHTEHGGFVIAMDALAKPAVQPKRMALAPLARDNQENNEPPSQQRDQENQPPQIKVMYKDFDAADNVTISSAAAAAAARTMMAIPIKAVVLKSGQEDDDEEDDNATSAAAMTMRTRQAVRLLEDGLNATLTDDEESGFSGDDDVLVIGVKPSPEHIVIKASPTKKKATSKLAGLRARAARTLTANNQPGANGGGDSDDKQKQATAMMMRRSSNVHALRGVDARFSIIPSANMRAGMPLFVLDEDDEDDGGGGGDENLPIVVPASSRRGATMPFDAAHHRAMLDRVLPELRERDNDYFDCHDFREPSLSALEMASAKRRQSMARDSTVTDLLQLECALVVVNAPAGAAEHPSGLTKTSTYVVTGLDLGDDGGGASSSCDDEVLDDSSLEEQLMLLKLSEPPNWWEYSIGRKLFARLPEWIRPRFAEVKSIHVYGRRSFSLIAHTDDPTLDEVLALCHQKSKPMCEELIVYHCIELLRLVEHMHRASMLHCALSTHVLIARQNSSATDDAELPEWSDSAHRAPGWQQTCLGLCNYASTIDVSMYQANQASSSSSSNNDDGIVHFARQGASPTFNVEIDTLAVCRIALQMLGASAERAAAIVDSRSVSAAMAIVPTDFVGGKCWHRLFDRLMNIGSIGVAASAKLLEQLRRLFEQHIVADARRRRQVKLALSQQRLNLAMYRGSPMTTMTMTQYLPPI
jgi:Mad3/BUB1 homology region 1